jgi:hypothetical protein
VPATITVRLARYSFGIIANASEGSEDDCTDDECLAKQEMKWVLRRVRKSVNAWKTIRTAADRMTQGDEIKYDVPIKVDCSQDIRLSIFNFKDRTFKKSLYYCQNTYPPATREKCKIPPPP